MTMADQRLQLLERSGALCLLIFADVDGLKAANDTIGHEAGDRLLIDAARALQAAFRRTDLVAAAPLPATGQKLGEAKAEMIVGGAAFLLGAIMDNDAGSVLMVGGAILGLYGLWNYLK